MQILFTIYIHRVIYRAALKTHINIIAVAVIATKHVNYTMMIAVTATMLFFHVKCIASGKVAVRF